MIQRAILQQIANLDKPVAPSEEGLSELFSGLTSEDYQKRRDSFFNVTKESVINVAKKLKNSRRRYSIVGGASKSPNGFVIIPVESESFKQL